MPRILLTFTLSDASPLQDLVREFALHDGVEVRAYDDGVTLVVETDDSPTAMWNVRATVGMFDDRAVESTELADGPSA